jgi:preprotein translocase subunit YajC
MDLNGVQTFLAQAAPAGAVPDPRAQMIQTVGLFALMGVMLYFVMIRPQQKKAKEQAELLKGVKPGDKVMTSSGIVGVVVTVKDKTFTLRSADTKLELVKSAISEITERGSQTSES